jgi:hypothetical protein
MLLNIFGVTGLFRGFLFAYVKNMGYLPVYIESTKIDLFGDERDGYGRRFRRY